MDSDIDTDTDTDTDSDTDGDTDDTRKAAQTPDSPRPHSPLPSPFIPPPPPTTPPPTHRLHHHHLLLLRHHHHHHLLLRHHHPHHHPNYPGASTTQTGQGGRWARRKAPGPGAESGRALVCVLR